MGSLWLWILAVAVGTAAVSFTATSSQPVHMAVTALVCAAFVVLAVLHQRNALAVGGSEPALASTNATSIGMVWAWAGLSMLVTYGAILSWHEWWQYVLASGAVAAVSLFFASMMSKDAAAGRRDETLLNLARYLTIGQLAGMVVAMIGMIVDNKMPRDPSEPDWAANAIFFFGAAALAAISLNALRAPRRS